jgi:hypothetical protein
MNGLLEKNASESAPIATLPIGTYREIPLTQGKVVIVDPEDYEWLSQYNWHAVFMHGKWYASRVVCKDGKKCNEFMHRLLLNVPKGKQTDHKNNNGLDNRRSNIRECTCMENQHNQKPRTNLKSSQFKGVHWHKRDLKWVAGIKVNGKRKDLGEFDSEINAAVTHDLAAIKYFGEFANLNFKEMGK